MQGNNTLAVVEGTATGASTGSVYALNAQTGATIWQTNLPGDVLAR